jgi:MFS family permease
MGCVAGTPEQASPAAAMVDALPPPRRVLSPLGLAICLSLFGDLTLFAVLVSELDTVGLSLGAAGIMLGIHRLIRIPGNPLAGLVYDRRGRRTLFVVGMVLAVLSTAGYGLVHGFWPFLFARLAWGVAWILLHVGGLTMVLDISVPSNRGRWMGVYNAWVVAGLALGPLVGGFLVDAVGFRAGLLICAGISAAGLVVAAVALPETAPLGRGSGAQPAASAAIRARLSRKGIAATLDANRRLAQPLLLYLIVQFTGEGVVLATVSLLLQQRFGTEVPLGSTVLGVASAGGLVLGLRSVLAAVAGPLAGNLSDARAGRGPVIAAGLVAGLLGFALLAYARSLGLLVVGVALGALGSGAILSALPALVGDLAPAGRQGAVMGAYAAAGDVGSTAGPLLAFALVTVVDLRWVYLLCSLAFLAGLGLAWPRHQAPAH